MSGGSAECVELDADAVKQLIPHRDPFLFIEAATLQPPNEASGRFAWKSSHPILHGHFPGRPVVPGVCQVEAIAQLGGALVAYRLRGRNGESVADSIGFLASVRRAMFHTPIQPEQSVVFRVSLRAVNPTLLLLSGSASVGGLVAVKCELVVALAKPEPSTRFA
jgi:3-hydroxyacyl-[acyl-carrier-protein] dehydratase